MKKLLIYFSLLLSVSAIAQDPLTFNELGTEPAYCRLFGYQSGNGVVYASTTGGTPGYSYVWTELATGATQPTSTWGGRNSGLYEIVVTDAIGVTLTDTIFLDSLNPIADFNVISDDLDSVSWGFIGNAPAIVSFENTSIYYANPLDPTADTTIFFRPQGFEDWVVYYEAYGLSETYTYEFGGLFTASLVAINKNGCSDTTHKTIGLFGVLGLETGKTAEYFSIATHSINNSIAIKQNGFADGILIRFYAMNGQLIQEENINDSETILNLNLSSGIYLYEAIDPSTGQQISSGKLSF